MPISVSASCTLGLNTHRVHRNISFRVYSSRISHLNVVHYRFILTIFISMSTFSGHASSASDRSPHPTSGNTLLYLSRNTAEPHVPLTFNRRETVRQTDCPGRSLREKSRHVGWSHTPWPHPQVADNRSGRNKTHLLDEDGSVQDVLRSQRRRRCFQDLLNLRFSKH